MKNGLFWALAMVAGMALIGGSVYMKQPRGIRNKNPLNIEKGAPWNGLASVQTDSRFAQFVDHRYGYRAAARIVDNYRARGVKTLSQIVSTWAPSVENNTMAYINSVAQKTGIAPDQEVTRDHYAPLFAAMTVHENGVNPYPIEDILEGISWA